MKKMNFIIPHVTKCGHDKHVTANLNQIKDQLRVTLFFQSCMTCFTSIALLYTYVSLLWQGNGNCLVVARTLVPSVPVMVSIMAESTISWSCTKPRKYLKSSAKLSRDCGLQILSLILWVCWTLSMSIRILYIRWLGISWWESRFLRALSWSAFVKTIPVKKGKSHALHANLFFKVLQFRPTEI